MQQFENNVEILETIERLLKDGQKDQALECVYNLENSFQSNNLLPAQKAHIIGCAWFELIDKEEGAIRNSISWFSKAIETDHTSQFSRYYLGVLYYSEKSYENAVNALNNIPAEYFAGNYDQEWRDLNIRMYLACAKAMSGIWELDEFVEICQIYRDDKSMDFDYPDPLVQICLDNINNTPSIMPQSFPEIVANMIENNKEYLGWYATELRLFKKYLGGSI